MGKIQVGLTTIAICTMLVACGNSEAKQATTEESQGIQANTDLGMISNIPESATNGFWENSYVDIQQKNGKYETRIYLDSADATHAECIYFVVSVALSVNERDVESDFFVVTSDSEYKLDMDENFSDIGFPKEWTEFLKDSEDEGNTILESISTKFSNSLESWIKYSFEKYLNSVIIEEKESEAKNQAETVTEKETEEELESLARKTYSYDDGSEMTLVLSRDDNSKFHFTIGIYVDDKGKAAYAFTVLCKTAQIDELKELNTVVVLNCGNDTLTSSGFSIDAEGNLINNSEWLTEGLTSDEYDSEGASLLIDNMAESISDFTTNEMGKYIF